MLELQTMLLLIPEHLCANSYSFSDHFPQVDTPFQKAAQPDSDASVCISKFDSHCLTLNFLPTKEVLALTACLILHLPGMNKLGLVIAFAVCVNTLVVDELVEMPGQLSTSDLSILLIQKHWIESEKGDSDISN